MTAITFDTHFHIKKLRDRGVSEPQAEAFVEMLRDVQQENLQSAATKADLRELELRMTVKLGGMIVALGGLLIAVKYFG